MEGANLTHVFTLLVAISTGLALICQVALHWKLSRDRRAQLELKADFVFPPLSVLKPLCGVDESLYENLASLAAQDYPEFELIMGTEDPSDPALAVAQRLRAAFPAVTIRVVSGAPNLGRNPKVNNLAWLSKQATHEHLLISDSNVRARPDYLRAIASELQDPNVGLVANLLTGAGEESLGAIFENLHLGSFVSAGMAAAEWLGDRACVVGKSMLFRRSDLEAMGGWRALRNFLAEDYVLGHRFEQLGRRVVISSHVVEVWNQSWSVRRFMSRHLRWAQMRRRITLPTFLIEPLLSPTPWALGLLFAACANEDLVRAERVPLALLATVVLAAKAFGDGLLARRLRGHGFRAAELAWVPVKDLAILALWPVAALRSTCSWRGHALRIGPMSRLLKHRPRLRRRVRAMRASFQRA